MAKPTLIAGKIAAENRKARHEYSIQDTLEAGIILEGTHARAQAGKADAATGARLHDTAVALLDRAREHIASHKVTR